MGTRVLFTESKWEETKFNRAVVHVTLIRQAYVYEIDTIFDCNRRQWSSRYF